MISLVTLITFIFEISYALQRDSTVSRKWKERPNATKLIQNKAETKQNSDKASVTTISKCQNEMVAAMFRKAPKTAIKSNINVDQAPAIFQQTSTCKRNSNKYNDDLVATLFDKTPAVQNYIPSSHKQIVIAKAIESCRLLQQTLQKTTTKHRVVVDTTTRNTRKQRNKAGIKRRVVVDHSNTITRPKNKTGFSVCIQKIELSNGLLKETVASAASWRRSKTRSQ